MKKDVWVLWRWGGMWHRAKTLDPNPQLYNAYCGHASHYVAKADDFPGEKSRATTGTTLCTTCLLAHVRVQGRHWGQSWALPTQWHLIVDRYEETVSSACGEYRWRPALIVADENVHASRKCPSCLAYLVEVPLFDASDRDPFADDLL